jgi:hypothetical protein
MDDDEVVRVNAAARLALVKGPDGRTRWTPYSPVDAAPRHSTAVAASPIELQHKSTPSAGGGRLDLDASSFPGRPHFRLVPPSSSALPPQNLLLFLHSRGDSNEPFARLGQQMALPQTGRCTASLPPPPPMLMIKLKRVFPCERTTAVVSLRAPRELPFGLGFTWLHDLDASGDVISPEVPHAQRSERWAVQFSYLRCLGRG